MAASKVNYTFWSRPIKYSIHFAKEHPAYFWTIAMSAPIPLILVSLPSVNEWWTGKPYVLPESVPWNYPIPSGPRNPPDGFEDPPPGQVEPTWYRHEPPARIRKAFEAQGYKWEDVLKELERRRDAMVEGNEWDVQLENGQIVWKKPSAETVTKQVQTAHDFRQWGSGWRSYVLWGIWRLMGSPEGVYETEDGKVDGKLVLRDLQKKRKDAVVEKKSEDGEAKQ